MFFILAGFSGAEAYPPPLKGEIIQTPGQSTVTESDEGHYRQRHT
jgi:hypothetical protein